jgi:hypothetical protein
MPEEYIKRTDAVKIAEKYGLANGSVLGRHTGLADCIASEISELPAADVAPVVHGWWKKVRKSRSTWECSVCGTKVGAFFAGCSQYCYCCGAQMGGITE